MFTMPATNHRSDDWKMLTLVGLADRLAAKTAPEKDPVGRIQDSPSVHFKKVLPARQPSCRDQRLT